MKRTAFTLVELMVVIAIVGLLVAIVVPSMSSVYSLARQTFCCNNLQRLGEAFTISSSGKAMRLKSAGTSEIVSAYPKAMAWPTVPRDAIDEPTIYECPEEPVKKNAAQDMFKLLEYVCPYGRFPMDTMGGASTFYISRVGEDEKGVYTEYMLQDDYGNGQFEMMDFQGWHDTDGFVRVYHSGSIWIPSRVPDTPEFTGAHGPGYPNRLNTCPDLNAIYYRGKPAFGAEGRTRNHRDKTYPLPDWNVGGTNYGINSYAYRYAYGSKCVVLVDYPELIVEVDTAVKTEELLLQSGRHLGKLNYLRGDGSVRTVRPMDLSPRLHIEAWDPADEIGKIR